MTDILAIPSGIPLFVLMFSPWSPIPPLHPLLRVNDISPIRRIVDVLLFPGAWVHVGCHKYPPGGALAMSLTMFLFLNIGEIKLTSAIFNINTSP
jgi:hypothetical protein